MKQKKTIIIVAVAVLAALAALVVLPWLRVRPGNTPLSAQLSGETLPEGFPRYLVTGQSISDQPYYVTPHTTNYEQGWLMEMNSRGELLWYKELPAYAYLFRHFINEDGQARYAYMQVDEQTAFAPGTLENTHIVLMDDDHNVIRDDIRPLAHGSIPEGHPCENHEYVVLGDDHFILTAAVPMVVTDIPGFEGREVFVFNSIFQEQKDGEVVFQFESIEHPELYGASLAQNNFGETGPDAENAADYAHINSINIDAETGDYLVSFRNTGIAKISRETGEILWNMGRGLNSFYNLWEHQVPLYQHDARYLPDGSFTVFDNMGCQKEKSRICRYLVDRELPLIDSYEELITNFPRSLFMGSAQLIDDETDTYLITYGSDFTEIAFEEYDFMNKKQNMLLRFVDGYDLYSLTQGDADQGVGRREERSDD